MAYDPNKPAPGDDLDAVLVRNQLNALKALIDALSATVTALQGQLGSVFQGSSNNSNAVATLGQTASSSYDQGQMQSLFDKMDELINTLRR